MSVELAGYKKCAARRQTLDFATWSATARLGVSLNGVSACLGAFSCMLRFPSVWMASASMQHYTIKKDCAKGFFVNYCNLSRESHTVNNNVRGRTSRTHKRYF